MRCPPERECQHLVLCPSFFDWERGPTEGIREPYHFVLASVKSSAQSGIASKRMCRGIGITYGHNHSESFV